MLKPVVVIVMVGAACAAPVTPTLRRCADGHLASANGADTSSNVESSVWEKRWGHARFFKGLTDQVNQHWQPTRVWQRLGAKTAVHRFGTLITEVAVSMARNGHLLAICVVSPSGINELDEEAVRAFWAAAPFRDPPVDIFENREHVTFPFAFHLREGTPSMLRAPTL